MAEEYIVARENADARAAKPLYDHPKHSEALHLPERWREFAARSLGHRHPSPRSYCWTLASRRSGGLQRGRKNRSIGTSG